MTGPNPLEGSLSRLAGLAAVGFLAFDVGDNTSAFLGAFVPMEWAIENDIYWVREYIPALLGYSLTGFLFALALWFLFKDSIKQFLVYLPGFIVIGRLITSYHAFNERGDGDFSPFRVVSHLLTSYSGLLLLIAVPAATFMTISFLQKKSLAWSDGTR